MIFRSFAEIFILRVADDCINLDVAISSNLSLIRNLPESQHRRQMCMLANQ